jgi:protein-S-isoprenylcysteine O-methyltransferase Ste14
MFEALWPTRPDSAMRLAWLVWWASWLAAALWRDRAAKRPPVRREILYRVLVLVGVTFLFGFVRFTRDEVLWRVSAPAAWAMVGAAIAGFGFTWWARLHLGRLWSSSVTRKADHHIVDTGPYGIVRHPIYTGVILATVATAAMRGTALSWFGCAVMTLGWYVKARVEEGFLREELGREAYDAYARRVPMLVPFL